MATALTRYPYAARRLRRPVLNVDRFFDDFNRSFLGPTKRRAPALVEGLPGFNPRVQAQESENEYRLVAEMPGVDLADFEVTIDDGVLVLKGERKWDFGKQADASDAQPEAAEESAEQEGAGASEQEGVYNASFERRFRFGAEVDAEAVKAVYKDGLLTVTVPKRVEPEPQPLSIPISCE
jgi:HSP20 family protein